MNTHASTDLQPCPQLAWVRCAVAVLSMCCSLGLLSAQEQAHEPPVDTFLQGLDRTDLAGQDMGILITEEGDTLLVATTLSDVSVSSPRSFDSEEERKLYYKYRYYAPSVYPYALQAIRIYRETQHVTATMDKRAARKHIKRLQKELKKEFEDPLRKLTRTQGLILLKMIERETEIPMHELVRDMRGGMTATYWNTISKLAGYDLKTGYVLGEDPILDIVLLDYDVSHDVDEATVDSFSLDSRQ